MLSDIFGFRAAGDVVADTLNDGRYELQGMLGQGGMATVWRAYDTRLDVHRAIKVLLPQYASRPKLRQRFNSEARTMAKLHHPNITTVHDVGEDGDSVFMVMELVEGGSLHDRLKSGPLTPQQASEVMQKVLAAMHVAHSRGVVHRDIKPHNILISAEGAPKVTDFGIAQLQGNDHRTRTGAVMGTLAYMSPEQQLNSKGVDARADVYALGVTLYTLVRGEEPNDSLYVSETHSTALAGLSEPMQALIKKATRYRPEDRFQTVEEFRLALKSAHRHLDQGQNPEPLGRPQPDGEKGAWGPTLGPERNDTLDIAAMGQEPGSQTFSFEGMMVEPATPPLGSEGPPLVHSQSLVPDPADEDPGNFTLGDPAESDPPPVTASTEVPARRRSPVLAFAAAGVALLAGVVLVVLQPWASDPAPEEVPEPVPVSVELETPSPEPKPEPKQAAEPEPTAQPEPAQPKPAVATPKPKPVQTTPKPQPKAQPEPQPEPEPEPEAKPEPEPVAATTGTLMLNSLPWSNITIDGQGKGTTDWKGDLPAGKHNVVLTTSDGRVNRTVLDIQAGETKRWCWDFDTGAQCSR